MRITNMKNMSAYLYKMYPYFFDNHPTTIRNKQRGYRSWKRKKSFFSMLEKKAFYMSFEKFGY